MTTPTASPPHLADVCAFLGLPPPARDPGGTVTGLAQDSRTVRPGEVYLARPGERTHGADHAAAAAAAGAVAAVTDPAGAARCRAAGLTTLVVPDPAGAAGPLAQFVLGEPARRLRTFGITGTNGKTTTAFMLAAMLEAVDLPTGVIGTVMTRVGGHDTPSARTTPEAPDLARLMAAMVAAGDRACVMEVSSHALALGRVAGIVVDQALFLNFSQDHLELHGDMESYYRAKASLFEPDRAAAAVVDITSEAGARLAAEATVPVVTLDSSAVTGEGSGPRADYHLAEVRLRPTGSTGRLLGPRLPAGGLRLEVPLPGGFNLANAAAAAVAVAEAGLDAQAAAAGLAGVTVPGRMEQVATSRGVRAVVDFAHTPEAVAAVLDGLRSGMPAGRRLFAVAGCGGDRDPGKRGPMGEALGRAADVVVVTDDNPRSEDPARVRAAALVGARRGGRARVIEIADRARAIRTALDMAAAGDVVAVLGKGHETGQEVAGVVHPFSDRDVITAWAAGPRETTAPPLTLGDLAAATGATLVGGAPGDPVTGSVRTDNRGLAPGDVFVALAGDSFDGHDFVEAALADGAVAAVVATGAFAGAGPLLEVADTETALAALARLWLSRFAPTVVGVTGSSGKTSTKDMLAFVLARAGSTVVPAESLNNEIGVPQTALAVGPETDFLVSEMGARGQGHIRYLCDIVAPSIGVVLNVGHAHVGQFRSQDAIAAAKGELVQALPPGGTAVLNADDPRVVAMAARAGAGVRVLTFGTSEGPDVTSRDLTLDLDGRSSFTLAIEGEGTAQVTLAFAGTHMVSNALAAAAVGHAVGLPVAEIARGLSAARPRARWRMEVRSRPDGVTIVNDAYNANPESMAAALAALAHLAGTEPPRRQIAVLGEMLELGEESPAAHREVGRLAVTSGVAVVVAVGEGAAQVVEGAVAAGARSGDTADPSLEADVPLVVHAPDREAAADLLGALLTPGDLVLVKSSRDAGLRWLGDDLAAGRVPAGDGTHARREDRR